ncbi:MAG: copper amine oxidase N-terminal domain-containing protein [Deltaproteobacteria bacterium]|nr:copper amine oxidase N-terminal domain-containing protein [Deltaproteobacteria bacterium]
MNRRLPVLALGLLLLWTMPPARLAGAGARLVVPGEEPKAIERVYHVDGTDYFSAAAILEALGMTTAWQARPGKLVARRGEDFIVLAPDLRFAVSGTSSYRLDKPPRFINGEIFVTREFVERALPVLLRPDRDPR